METQLALYLTLFHSAAFSGHQYSRLIKYFGGINPLASASQQVLSSLGLSRQQMAAVHTGDKNPDTKNKVSTYLKWATEANHHIICYEDAFYPPLLREIDFPPPLLFAIGNPQMLALPQFAMVGSRQATALGRQNAYWMSDVLARHGLCICSGMAAGIDTQAHLGSLSSGGSTVAVLGTGVDRIYPKSNQKLAAQISQSGILISEFPLGTAPISRNFPRRNRIISGMSLGVLVVEAAVKSGSLITARTAMEQNREVFAIPGAITNPLSRGCHRLIKEGVKLVETPEDILEEIRSQYDQEFWLQGSAAVNAATTTAKIEDNSQGKLNHAEVAIPSAAQNYKPSAIEAKILAALDYANCPLDGLIRETELELQELISALLKLESSGIIEQVAGRYNRLQ